MCNLLFGFVVPIPTFAACIDVVEIFLYLIIIIPDPPLPPTVSEYLAPPPPEPVEAPACFPDAKLYPLVPSLPLIV